MSARDPEHFYIGPSYMDPADLDAYDLARSNWADERADRRRDIEDDERSARRDAK